MCCRSSGIRIRVLPEDSEAALFGGSFLIRGSRAVYLFDDRRGEWLGTFRDPVDSPFGDAFGGALAVLGGNVLVGDESEYAPTPPYYPGAAYVFDGSSGELIGTFSSPTPSDHIHFGASLAAGESGSDSERAGVFLFDGSTGEVLRRFMYPAFEHADQFGRSVAVVGDDVLVSSWQADAGGGGYLFEGATGNLLLTLHDPGFGRPEEERYGTYFGDCVAAFGRDILISAPGDDSEGHNVGRVYLMQGVPEPSTFA